MAVPEPGGAVPGLQRRTGQPKSGLQACGELPGVVAKAPEDCESVHHVDI